VVDKLNESRQNLIQQSVEKVHEAIDKLMQEEPVICSFQCNGFTLGYLIKAAKQMGIFPKPAAPFIDLSYSQVHDLMLIRPESYWVHLGYCYHGNDVVFHYNHRDAPEPTDLCGVNRELQQFVIDLQQKPENLGLDLKSFPCSNGQQRH
jgi:hypothetical protein